MIVYTCKKTGEQLISSSYLQKPLIYNGVEFPGIVVVSSALVSKGGETFNIGANASAEVDDEEVDDTVEKVNNIIDADVGFDYNGPTNLDKKEALLLFKKWCGAIKDSIVQRGEKPKPFMDSAKLFASDFFNKEFKKLDFYQTPSYECLIIGWWDEEANLSGSPKFIYFSHAMDEKKY